MLSYISRNWRGRPLVRIETIINQISATKTKKGLIVHSISESAWDRTCQRLQIFTSSYSAKHLYGRHSSLENPFPMKVFAHFSGQEARHAGH